MNPTGLWRIDGIDLWTTYGILLSEGSADFLKYPPKKESTTHDWGDSDGIDVDLQRIFLGQNEGVLSFVIIANSTQQYFDRHDAFINLWKKPGLRRLEIAAHNDRSYYIFYKETNNYSQVGRHELRPGNPLAQYDIIHRFSMVVVEPEPKIYPGNVYIVTEDGKFLIS
jgi:hypothetical protein